jgi:hypothetical protein
VQEESLLVQSEHGSSKVEKWEPTPVVSSTPTPLSTKNPTPVSTLATDKLSEGPRIFSKDLTPQAKDFLKKFEGAIIQKDANLLGDLVFDADCCGEDLKLDLQWYENMAAQL